MRIMGMQCMWVICKSESSLSFFIKHLLVVVKGRLEAFEGNYLQEVKGKGSHITFSAQTENIFTGIKSRDKHLKSKDFFDVESYPMMTFSSTTIAKKTPNGLTISGQLTIKKNIIPLEISAKRLKPVIDDEPNTLRYKITGSIPLKACGFVWNKITEEGMQILGDEIKVNGAIKLIQHV